MNYLKQINAFWNWRLINRIAHAEVDLYMGILHMFNRFSRPARLTIPNSTLVNLCGFSDASQLTKSRNKLVQSGLIEYRKGKAGKAGEYILCQIDNDCDNDCDNGFDNSLDNDCDNVFDTDCDNIIKEKERVRVRVKNITPCSPSNHKDNIHEAVELYNSICKSLPKVTSISDARRKAVKARLNKYSMEQFREVFEKAESSDFLRGANNRNWQANFDWLMKDGNFAKTLDGNYANRGAPDTAHDSCMSGTDNISEIERQFMGCYGG